MTAPTRSRRRPWCWLLAGVGAVALAWPFDNRVDAALDVTNRAGLHKVAWWCSEIGQGWVIGAAGIFLAAMFFLANRPRLAADIFFIALASEITGLAATILRVILSLIHISEPTRQAEISYAV